MSPTPTRRRVIQSGLAAAASLAVERASYAGGGDVLRVGLIGCGGRGTGAASQALQADSNAKLTAMADAFADRIELSHGNLERQPELKGKLDVPAERRFAGFDGYKQVIEHSDVVLLATPPQFRPLHLKAAIEAGKHVFAEKPVAVDAPGVRSVLETCKLAEKKKLSVVSGLCLRYSYGFQAAVKLVHDGAIGEVVTLRANDYRGPIWVRTRDELAAQLGRPPTEMEYQMRNWYYFTWLSGDFNVEQHVHFLDVASWLIGKYPVKAIGMGGRIVRNGPEYGNVYDHFSVTYEYDTGATLHSNTRQMTGCTNDLACYVQGTKGRGELSERGQGLRFAFADGKTWQYEGPRNPFYQTEHDELFASIRNGNPINNGEYMAHSTLLAVMGRMCAYTGQQLTWQQALNSKLDLSPAGHAWDAAPPPADVAKPGVTKFT